MDSIIDTLAEKELALNSEIIDPIHLEASVERVLAEEELTVEECDGLNRLMQDSLTGKTFTLGFLRRVNARLAEVYNTVHNATVHTASRSIAAVDDVIFARSTGEAGRVLAVIGTGSPSYQDTVKEYQKRYGWKQSIAVENALALYKVVHADGKEELYFDTETTADSSYVRVPETSREAQAVLVDVAILKEALNLWWNLLPENERALQFSRHGSDLKILERLQTKLAEVREESLGDTHPLLLTTYAHVKANGLAKKATFVEARFPICRNCNDGNCFSCEGKNYEGHACECPVCKEKGGVTEEKKASKMIFWDVILNGKVIDSVPYTESCDADYVKRSLIGHDGYDSGISVRKAKSAEKTAAEDWQTLIAKFEPTTDDLKDSPEGKRYNWEKNKDLVLYKPSGEIFGTIPWHYDESIKRIKRTKKFNNAGFVYNVQFENEDEANKKSAEEKEVSEGEETEPAVLPTPTDAVNMVGDGKEPNYFWVTVSDDWDVASPAKAKQPGEINSACELYKFECKGGTEKVFSTLEEAVDYIESYGLVPPDQAGYHSAIVEDRLSGEVYRAGWTEYPITKIHPGTKKPYTVPKYEYESYNG